MIFRLRVYLRLVAWCARLRLERHWLVATGVDPASLNWPAWPRWNPVQR